MNQDCSLIGGDLSSEAFGPGICQWNFPLVFRRRTYFMVVTRSSNGSFSEKLKVSKSLKQSIRNKSFEVKFDSNFEAVVEKCSASSLRLGQEGTWITEEYEKGIY